MTLSRKTSWKVITIAHLKGKYQTLFLWFSADLFKSLTSNVLQVLFVWHQKDSRQNNKNKCLFNPWQQVSWIRFSVQVQIFWYNETITDFRKLKSLYSGDECKWECKMHIFIEHYVFAKILKESGAKVSASTTNWVWYCPNRKSCSAR